MAAKKKGGKKLGKKEMKKTKGGILVSSYNPALKLDGTSAINTNLKIDAADISGIHFK